MRRCSKPLSTIIGSVEECRCKGGKSLSKKIPASVFSGRGASSAGPVPWPNSQDPKRNCSSAGLEAVFGKYVFGSSRGCWSDAKSWERTRPLLQKYVDSAKSEQSVSRRSEELLEVGDVDLDGRVSCWESRARYLVRGMVADGRSMSGCHGGGQQFI